MIEKNVKFISVEINRFGIRVTIGKQNILWSLWGIENTLPGRIRAEYSGNAIASP